MFVYGVSPGVVQTTNATPITALCSLQHTHVVARPLSILGLYVHGRGAGLTAISGLSFRIRRVGVFFTGGTSITASPRDPGAPATGHTFVYDPTQDGTASTPHFLSIGCGAAGASGWFAGGNQSLLQFQELNFLVFVAAGLASMSYEQSLEVAT